MTICRAFLFQPSVCEFRESMHSSLSKLIQKVCRKTSHAWEHAKYFCMTPLSHCQPRSACLRYLCHAISHNDRTFLFNPPAAESVSLCLTEVPLLNSISYRKTLTRLLHSLIPRVSHAASFECRSATSCILQTRHDPLLCFERLNVHFC